MRPGDRIICALVDNQAVGSQFKEWPLHITIVPWFRLTIASSELAALLKKSYIGSKQFTALVTDEAQFGYKKTKTVNLVEAPELKRLEGQTRRLLHTHRAWVVDEADKTRGRFRPHITVLKAGRMHQGDHFICDRLYIVSQHGDYKMIDAEIILEP